MFYDRVSDFFETEGDFEENQDTFDYTATHVSVCDGSDAMLVTQTADRITLVNEDGFVWTDNASDWRQV